MKLIDARDEEAIELLADLIDPIGVIAQDKEISYALRTGQKAKAIKFSMKKHPSTIREILAICEGVPFEDYHPSALEIPAKLLFVLNRPDVQSLFTTQAQTVETSFGSATASTEDTDE